MIKLICLFLLIINFVAPQTTAEINEAKRLIRDRGMTEKEVIKAAKSHGFSDKEINEVIKNEKATLNKTKNKFNYENNYKSLKGSEKEIEVDNKNKKDDPSNKNYPSNKSSIIEKNPEKKDIIKDKETSNHSLEFFGYNIFKKDPSLFQSSSVGAVDPNYSIGPGDEIIVMLWGETQFRQVMTVDREGFVFIPEIGQVFVNGLNLNLLESKLFKVFSQSYASLNPVSGAPTTFLDFSLGKLRPLRIQVLGEVSQPGAYTLSPTATLFSSLYYFNGPTTNGTLRNIQLIRGDDQIGTIDFYDYLLTGKKIKDKKLQLDDIIFIPRRKKTVSIQGEINRIGIYELLETETLKDLIKIAGGVKSTAYLGRCQIDRITPFEDRLSTGQERLYVDVDLRSIIDTEKDLEIKDGDKIQIFSILDSRNNIVTLEGAVKRPGNYDLGDSLKISQLIKKAGGLNGDAYLSKVDILRLNPDLTDEIIKLNLEEIISGDEDLNLQGMDLVKVYGMNQMTSKRYVSVSGFVKKPGKYELKKNITLYDMIFKAGGFIDEEFKKEAFLNRADLIRLDPKGEKKKIIPFDLGSLLDKKGIADVELKPQDSIHIYSKKFIKGDKPHVILSGNVKFPGKYELYEENMRISDILFIAAGFSDSSFKSSTFLERADLFRYDEDEITKSIISFNLEKVLNDKSHPDNYKLKNGDEINIYSRKIFNLNKKVKIEGVVKNPGSYDLKTGMTVKDLILISGGLTEDIFKYKIDIARIDPSISNENIYAQEYHLEMFNDYSFEVQKNTIAIDSGTFKNQFYLQAYDYVTIRPDPYFKMQRKVELRGEVYYPGFYTILKSTERISDVIKRSGGLRPNAYPFGSIFIRNGVSLNINLEEIIKNRRSKFNIVVQDGDIIELKKEPKSIKIVGEINAPGFYAFSKGQNISKLIKLAGGLTEKSDIKGIFIRYPNGVSKKYRKWFRNHKVFDGSIITVNTKGESDPIDKTELAKQVSTVFASVVQSISIIYLATK